MENDTIKVLIADDNSTICNQIAKYLGKFEEIEIVGLANNDYDEVIMIDTLKPDIVITDLMRKNYKYTGLDIIKKYSKNQYSPYFLIISSDKKDYIIKKDEKLKIGGYIEKPYYDDTIIIEEIRKIEKLLKNDKVIKGEISMEYEEWYEEYTNKKIISLYDELNSKELKILKKLGIEIEKNKIYTQSEFDTIRYEILRFYKSDGMDKEELKIVKPLKIGVRRKKYNKLIEKIQNIDDKYYEFYSKKLIKK